MIVSKPATQEYLDRFDLAFKGRQEPTELKIEHNGITVLLDTEGMNKGERWKAHNDITSCIDLYKAGRLKYMDLSSR